MRPLVVIDARTRVEHLVSEQSVAAHRHAGCYVAKCGAMVLAASLTEPGRGRCPEYVVSRADQTAASDAARKIDALVALLAEVVQLAEDRAVVPGHWAHIAELAREHQVALLSAGSKS